MDYLDKDVLTEILKRLPVKSLVQFKCVNRLWNCIISDPEFPLLEKLLIPVDDYSFSYLRDRVDRSIFTEFEMRPDGLKEDVSIYGSCHGLVCLRADDRRDFYLYNPTTGQLRQLPESGKDEYYHRVSDTEFLCGFGYDAVKDDYKILVRCMFRKWCKQIYSLKSNSWRSTPKGNQYKLEGQGMYSNGFLHWVNRERGVDTIVSFDLATEEFREALLPMPSFRLQGEGMQLSVTGAGSLVAYRIKGPRIEAWIMKDRGLNSTWTELCFFSYEPLMKEDPRNQPNRRIYPLVKDGKTLLCVRRGSNSIDIYDPKDGSLKNFLVPCSRHQYCVMTTYVESLVSVHVANRPL